jgi:hypothetical protein
MLERVIELSPCGSLTFIETEFGKPHTTKGLGNCFAHQCILAKVPGRAHGLRKASQPAIIAETAMIIAETGITDAIMTITTLGAGLDRPISKGGINRMPGAVLKPQSQFSSPALGQNQPQFPQGGPIGLAVGTIAAGAEIRL